MASTYTTAKEFDEAYSTLFDTFRSGKTKSLAWRKWQLKQLWWLVEDNEQQIIEALRQDLNRAESESFLTDLAGSKGDILYHLKNLDSWAADEPVEAGFLFKHLGGAHLRKEPLGVAFIIGPWNFPIVLILQPLIAAISAGCCVMAKPSELTTNCQQLLRDLVPKYLDSSAIRLVTGGAAETTYMLEHRFNHIFFTGSSAIARHVEVAAAKYLTPTVMELGGQDPAIVCKSADIDLAAKRIAFSKFMNAGQICLSTNHVFVDPAVHDEFVERMQHWNRTFLGGPPDSMTHIVNGKNFDRLTTLLENTNGTVVQKGQTDRESLRLEPTVVADVRIGDSLLTEELFGPICPIIKASSRQACEELNRSETPLAIYIFSSDQKEIDEVLNNTNSGGVTINDVILHAGCPGAPFGGVGGSGHGYYHGPYGFKAFTHLRTVLSPPTWLDRFMAFRYPPYAASIKGKLVKNKVSFKRGESMEDQMRSSSGSTITYVSLIASVAALAVLGQRLGNFWPGS